MMVVVEVVVVLEKEEKIISINDALDGYNAIHTQAKANMPNQKPNQHYIFSCLNSIWEENENCFYLTFTVEKMPQCGVVVVLNWNTKPYDVKAYKSQTTSKAALLVLMS